MKKEPDFTIGIQPIEDPIEQLREGVKLMKAGLKDQIEYQKLKAKLLRANYNALVAEGFSEDQALLLCQMNFR